MSTRFSFLSIFFWNYNRYKYNRTLEPFTHTAKIQHVNSRNKLRVCLSYHRFQLFSTDFQKRKMKNQPTPVSFSFSLFTVFLFITDDAKLLFGYIQKSLFHLLLQAYEAAFPEVLLFLDASHIPQFLL